MGSPLVLHGPQPSLTPMRSEAAGTPPDAALVETAGGCYARAAALERTGRQGQPAAAIVLELTCGVNLCVAL